MKYKCLFSVFLAVLIVSFSAAILAQTPKPLRYSHELLAAIALSHSQSACRLC